MINTTRWLWFVGWLVVAWCVMTVSHEAGHLVGGWLGGARVTEFDLAPWRLPYSLHSPDPYPLLTLWAGPLLGVILPLGFAAIIRNNWAWFVADFCVLANGCYLALAWMTGDAMLDTPRMLAAGANPIALAVFCVVTISWGYVRFRGHCVRHFKTPMT